MRSCQTVLRSACDARRAGTRRNNGGDECSLRLRRRIVCLVVTSRFRLRLAALPLQLLRLLLFLETVEVGF